MLCKSVFSGLINFVYMRLILKANKNIIAGILAAFGASLCCITPVLAILASASGMASTFAWIEPFRPYLIGVTIFIFGVAWYQQFKSSNDIDCNCETEKKSFWQSKTFLFIVTIFAALLLSFPYYSKAFFPSRKTQNFPVAKVSNEKRFDFKIHGMGCESCTLEVDNEISKVNGVLNYHTTFKPQSSIVKIDANKTSVDSIVSAINKTGYKVVSYNELKK